jgi:hypothetical protein
VIARKSLEGLSLDGVLRALQEAGVGSSHAGLQQAAIRFTPPSEEVRTHALGTIPSRVPPSGVAKSMVEVSDRWSRLQEWAANGWKRPRPPGATLGGSPPAPARYSDLEAADQAAALSAVFERLPEPDAPYDKPTVFRRLRSDAQVAARLLEVGLRRGEPDRAESGRARLEQTCIQCHRAYRD